MLYPFCKKEYEIPLFPVKKLQYVMERKPDDVFLMLRASRSPILVPLPLSLGRSKPLHWIRIRKLELYLSTSSSHSTSRFVLVQFNLYTRKLKWATLRNYRPQTTSTRHGTFSQPVSIRLWTDLRKVLIVRATLSSTGNLSPSTGSSSIR